MRSSNFLKFSFLLFFLQMFCGVQADDKTIPMPKWSYSFSKTELKTGDETELILTTTIHKDWYIYSTGVDCEVGPIKAELELKPNNTFKIIGNLYSVGDKTETDDIFGCKVGKFYHKAELRIKLKILKTNPQLSGELFGQMCSNISGQCVQLENPVFQFKGLNVSGNDVVPTETITPTENKNPTETPDINPNSDTSVKNFNASGGLIRSYKAKNKDEIGKCNTQTFENKPTSEQKESLWGFFLLAFSSGLIGLLTPCVFPMIPMTVSFFMKGKKSRAKAISTGLVFASSIVVIYLTVGILVALAFGEDAANFISTHWLPNILFFIIFMVFAASFFGAFELVLPSAMVNKIDRQADKGGLLGIFFMALTIAVVSFSCTGPIIGTVLLESVSGGGLRPVVGMLGFSLAFALPFGLFAIFPQWLNTLPKSGGWLNAVKVCLGFIEVAFGLKFLSVADQTYHWHILDREIYLVIWIIVFALMGLYLIGKIKFAHDSDLPFISVPRLFFAILTFAFVAYMVPGLWGAPLKGLAGYLPPLSTQDFDINRSIRESEGITGNMCGKASYRDQLHLPHGLNGYFDYEEAVACAKQLQKPLFIDITGHGCVNCRKMEEKVWSDPRVLKILKEDYVIVSLFVDDKKIKLPVEQQFISKRNGKQVTTLGQKNTEIAICLFGGNAQPYYVLLDNKEELLSTPVGAEIDGKLFNTEGFIKLLEDGKKRFDAQLKK